MKRPGSSLSRAAGEGSGDAVWGGTRMTTISPAAAIQRSHGSGLRSRVQDWLPRLVSAPSFLLILAFVYGFNLWTFYLSFTNSKAFTSNKLVGLANYQKLWTWTFETDPPSNW